ncbi:hypothetical protein ACW2QC_00185 [Virgibacillus sp. FSP13]
MDWVYQNGGEVIEGLQHIGENAVETVKGLGPILVWRTNVSKTIVPILIKIKVDLDIPYY